MCPTMCSIGLILSASPDSHPLGFLTPALGTLAYYLLIANRGRSDEQILEGDGASAKQIKLKSWQRPSTILTLMLGGFFFVRIVEHPSSEASWFAFEIICCLGFIIRDLENRAFKNMD
jgi:hypothetical protein